MKYLSDSYCRRSRRRFKSSADSLKSDETKSSSFMKKRLSSLSKTGHRGRLETKVIKQMQYYVSDSDDDDNDDDPKFLNIYMNLIQPPRKRIEKLKTNNFNISPEIKIPNHPNNIEDKMDYILSTFEDVDMSELEFFNFPIK
jgi:hypothetical protein